MSTKTKSDNEEEAKIKKSRITWNEITKHPTKRIIDYLGPTGLWLLSYYLFSLFMMVVVNIARIGWSFEAIFTGPIYIARIFINYGLNAGRIRDDIDLENPDDFYYDRIDLDNAMTSAAWLFAPMIIYVLGIFIVIMPASGFPLPLGDYDYNMNFLYFHEFVPFLNENKGGGFYFLIVWLPLLLSVSVSAFVSKRFFKGKQQPLVSVIKILIFNLIVGFAVGIQMAVITGDIDFKIRGAWQTIITGDQENLGFFYTLKNNPFYQGAYNPFSIMVTSWFINFIPMFLAVAWFALYGRFEDLILRKNKRIEQINIE